MSKFTVITAYLMMYLSSVDLKLPVLFLCLFTSQVIGMSCTALSSLVRWSLTRLLCWPYTRTHTVPGSPSASWAGTLTDKKIKVKYDLRVGEREGREREVQSTTCSPTQRSTNPARLTTSDVWLFKQTFELKHLEVWFWIWIVHEVWCLSLSREITLQIYQKKHDQGENRIITELLSK